jgi:hypothetical protein
MVGLLALLALRLIAKKLRAPMFLTGVSNQPIEKALNLARFDASFVSCSRLSSAHLSASDRHLDAMSTFDELALLKLTDIPDSAGRRAKEELTFPSKESGVMTRPPLRASEWRIARGALFLRTKDFLDRDIRAREDPSPLVCQGQVTKTTSFAVCHKGRSDPSALTQTRRSISLETGP